MSRNIASLRADLESLQKDLDNWEIDSDDNECARAYDDALDEIHGDFLGMSASRILKECDPTAYRCGFHDWADGMDKESFRAYRDLQSDVQEAQEALDEAEEE
jgi:hypothetical protein